MKKSFLFLLLLLTLAAHAQKQIGIAEQTWLGYIQHMRLSNRWGVTADAHFRTANNWVSGKNLWLLRVGATYFASERTQFTAGYTHFHYFPGESHPLAYRPEHRGWQQVLWINQASRLRLQNRIRVEQRWRRRINSSGGAGAGYNFNWRLRQQLQLLYPLGKKPFSTGSVALMVADEVMLNFGKEIVFNVFDQNRILVGVQLQTGANSVLQAGYMHLFQQQPSGRQYRRWHVARIFYTHNLDLRKKK